MKSKSTSEDRHLGFVIRVAFLCIVWYGISTSSNVIGKLLLRGFPYPTTRAMMQLFCTVVLLHPALKFLDVPQSKPFPARYFAFVIVPLAVGKFVALALSHVSIWKIPVSYAHTVKATMPLFVVALSRVILRERQSWAVYFSLVPIIVGVYVATVTEISFDLTGLLSALMSTFLFSLQNIFSKKVLREYDVHHLRLLQTLATLSLFLFVPFWMFFDGLPLFFGGHARPSEVNMRTLALAVVDGFLAFTQNLVAFTMLSLVSPVSYSVANASKRIVVIALSIALLQNPVTASNVAGMSIAIVGVFLYNKAKFDQRGHKLVATVPPFRFKEASLIDDDTFDRERAPVIVVHGAEDSAKGALLDSSIRGGYELVDVRIK